MRCDEVREHLSAYLDKELPAELTAAVRAHLQSCAECRRLSEALRATVDLLGRLPARAAPEGIAADVQREIERRALVATPAVESPPQERMLPLHRVRQWPRMLAVAATLLLAVGIGVLAYMGRPGLPAMQFAMPEAESAPAALPSAAPSASAPRTTMPSAFVPSAKEKPDSYAIAPREAPTAPSPAAPAVAQNLRATAPAPTSAALARAENGKDRRSGAAVKTPALKKEPAPEAPAAMDNLAVTGANRKPPAWDMNDDEVAPMKRAAEDKKSSLASLVPAKPQADKMSDPNGAKIETNATVAFTGLDRGATAAVPAGTAIEQKKPVKAVIDDTVKDADARAVAPTQLTMTLGDTSRALGVRTDTDGDGLRRPEKPGTSYFGTMAVPGSPPAATGETQWRSKAAPAPTGGKTLAANGGTLIENKVVIAPAPAAAPAPVAAPAAAGNVALGRPANTLESVRKAVDGAARGNLTARELGRTVTREQLLKAPDQLVIRADSLEAADKALVQLFQANGWRPVAADRGGGERWSEREKSVAANGGIVGAGGAVTDRLEINAGFAVADKKAKELPAPTGVYFLAESNGEDTWVVLTDRDTLSRFSSQLAAAEGMTVAMESSDEFRAVAQLQAQVRKLNEDRNDSESGELAKARTGVLVFNMYSGGTAVATAAKPANIENIEKPVEAKQREGAVKDLSAAPAAPALSAATAPAAAATAPTTAAAPAPVAGPAAGGAPAKGLAFKPAVPQEAAKAEKAKSELAYGGVGGGGVAAAKLGEAEGLKRSESGTVQYDSAGANLKAAESRPTLVAADRREWGWEREGRTASPNEVLLVIRVQRNVVDAAKKAAESAGKPAATKP